MKAVVDQALGDVHGVDAVLFLMRVAEDDFVHGGQGIGEIVDAFEMLADVIGVEHGVFGGLPDAGTVREDVGEGAHQDAEISGESLYAADGIGAHGLKSETAAVFLDKNRNGAKRLKEFLHGHRACAWTAAAVRRGGVENLGDFRDALLEDSERRRIGDHQRGDVGRHQFAEFVDVDLAVRFRLDVFDFVAGDHRGGGIGAMRGIGDQNFFARIALLLQVRADQQEAGEFALRARGGLQGDGVHAGDFEQALLEKAQDFEAALRKLLRLVRMLGGDAVEPGDEFIDARVVLHGAGTERIHAEVDRVVPGGEAREVADDFDFADFRESLNALAAVILAERIGGIDARDVERRQFKGALTRRGLLKDEAFVLAGVAKSFFDSAVQVCSVLVEQPFVAVRFAAATKVVLKLAVARPPASRCPNALWFP